VFPAKREYGSLLGAISKIVSQSFATSPEVIFNALTGDATFSSYIGTYTFVEGSTQVDSISIVTPGQDLPQLKSQSGLEIVIHDAGDITRNDWITDTSEAVIAWKVFLIVWPPANGTTMSLAARRMIEIFSKATAIETLSTSQGLGSLVQTMVIIPSDSAILT
jgi:hypothetical protein